MLCSNLNCFEFGSIQTVLLVNGVYKILFRVGLISVCGLPKVNCFKRKVYTV